jgi:cyclase
MKRARIIPVLLLQNNGLYKTVKFDKAKYIGDPINAVKIFNDKQCDEIILLDILASKQNKEINYKLIEEIASECFMPLAYGGGVSKIEHIEKLLKIGIEKIILNSILLSDPSFLETAVNYYGSSTIVASVDVKKNVFGKYLVYSHASKQIPSIPLLDFLKTIENRGAGELMINSVDLDGMMTGYDMKLAQTVSESLSIPSIICGGCSSFENIKHLFLTTHISAAAAGSFFIYHGPHKAVLINYPMPKQISEIHI